MVRPRFGGGLSAKVGEHVAIARLVPFHLGTMNQTIALALISESAKAEVSLVPSVRHYLRPKAKESLPLRLLLAVCAIERSVAPVPQASPVLRRLS